MRVVVVEDEAVVAQRLRRLIEVVLGDRLTSLVHSSSIAQARRHLHAGAVDLVFLDLNLAGRDGFRLLEETAAESFQTVVVSAHHDQAVRAFELGVTDFVPKPFAEERLRKAVARVEEREPELRDRLRYLTVRRASTIERVEVAELRYARGAGDYSELHCEGGERHLHSKGLSSLEQLLPQRFVRVHRSYVVDGSRIRKLRTRAGGRYGIVLDEGDEIPVARSRIGEIRSLMGAEAAIED